MKYRNLTAEEMQQLRIQGNLIDNVCVEDGVEIENIVGSRLKDVKIGKGVRVWGSSIEHYELCEGCCVMGSYLEVSEGLAEERCIHVLSESGDRRLYLLEDLDAQKAYDMVFHTFREGVVSGYEKMVFEQSCAYPKVGAYSEVKDGCNIKDSSIGNGVMLENFTADNCFIADCCILANGEAVAAFMGPHTVSHHKSTLLIAAHYSFFNAGSATNASNHHYRTGPMHQAYYERGVKTGSNSYVLYPAHVGAFSMVVGEHKGNPDSSDFPFSYLVVKDSGSHLLPAQILKTFGMWRDDKKWQTRDKRRVKRDRIDSDAVVNAYIVSKLLNAVEVGTELVEKSAGDTVKHKGYWVQKVLLRRAVESYRDTAKWMLTLMAYGGGYGEDMSCEAEVAKRCVWSDMGGLTVNYSADEEAGKVSQQAWAKAMLAELYPLKSEKELKEESVKILRATYETCLNDGERDFGGKNIISYGIDGDLVDREKDFIFVHKIEKVCDPVTGVMCSRKVVDGLLILREYIEHLEK